jgi:creatinine amidohydrolase
MLVHGMSEADVRVAREKAGRAIVPVGSMEQHGPHLPVSTDALIAEYVAKQVAPRVGAVVMPAIAYGVSYEHSPMFHASVQGSTLAATLRDVCASLAGYGFSEIIILNGHHGNMDALKEALQSLKGRVPAGTSVHVLHYWRAIDAPLGHAGDTETSLVLAIAPELVDMKKALPGAKKLEKSKAAHSGMSDTPGSFIKTTGNGVWGDLRNASAKKGRLLLKEISAKLTKAISELRS